VASEQLGYSVECSVNTDNLDCFAYISAGGADPDLREVSNLPLAGRLAGRIIVLESLVGFGTEAMAPLAPQ
jgi:hypothetical protein